MENQEKNVQKKLPVITAVYLILALGALLFVFWIGFSSFVGNSHEINRHLYRTILHQSVSDIESAIRNGKTIESYYGIDKLLLRTTSYIGKDAQAALTDAAGALVYATFDFDGAYAGLIRTEQVRPHMSRDGAQDRESAIVVSEGFELLIQPIYGQDGRQSGNLCLVYPAGEQGFYAQQSRGILIMTLVVAGCVMAAMLVWIAASGRAGGVLNGKLLIAVPVMMLMIGILIQSAFSFFSYQRQYREMMLQSAYTTCLYMESLVSHVHERGVPYDRMHGLDEFFADKLRHMPGLWDIKLVHVMADSRDVLVREDEYQIGVPISGGDGEINVRLDATISKQYIDEKMAETLLLSFISLVICIVAVIEITKLPELIMLRTGNGFEKTGTGQRAGIRIGLRLCSFLMYTGVYIVVPFSSMLVKQWRQGMFGLTIDVSAGIPVTAEIFALMIGSIVSAAIFRHVRIRGGLGMSLSLFIAANLICLLIADPYWLTALRFASGLGFSGVLYTLNYVVSYGAFEGDERSSALSGINSGLLGGIMAGGSLGAVIASTMGVAMCFVVAASVCAAAGAIFYTLMPWRALISKQRETQPERPAESGREHALILKSLLRPKALMYFLLVMAPLSLGLMFIVAGMPAFAQTSGLSPLLLSCGFLANGVAGIYLGAPLLKLLKRKLPGNALIAAVIVVGGVAIGIVVLPPAWLTLLICAFLLGIFDGLGTPTAMLIFLELPGIGAMRPVDALAVGNTIMRAINTLAPMAYGLIIAAAVGGTGAFAALGGAFIAAGALYMFVSGGVKQNAK